MDEPTSRPNAVGDGRYLMIVGVMLLLIIASLVFLWWRERRNARHLQSLLEAARSQPAGQQELLSRLAGMKVTGPDAIRRNDMPRLEMTVNGETRQVILISAGAGRRMGFEPGDLVRVAESAEPPADGGQVSPTSRPMEQ
jgi:hypothetical protein